MYRNKGTLYDLVLFLLAGTLAAQPQDKVPDPNSLTKSVKAIGYRVGGGSTKVDLIGTQLMPQSGGEIKIEARAGATKVEVAIKDATSPSTLRAEFLTCVLCIVTPDGRTGNTGEILVNKNGESKLDATRPAQTFAMIVTAEHYFAVRAPSEIVVLENDTRKKHERRDLSRQRRQAEWAAAKQAQMKAEADALKAMEEAARARQATIALRNQLLEQLNRILETRDTPRGLVVNMADVLFDFG